MIWSEPSYQECTQRKYKKYTAPKGNGPKKQKNNMKQYSTASAKHEQLAKAIAVLSVLMK